MATRRTPTRRNARRHAGPVAVEAFVASLPLRPHRENAVGDHEACGGVDRCNICDEYENLVAELAEALALSPNETNPIDVADVPAAPWLDKIAAAKWEAARALHVELCEAAGVDPARHIQPSDLHLGHTMVRWLERHCRTPDGPNIGKRVRLRPFQRDVVMRTYGAFGEHSETVRQALGAGARESVDEAFGKLEQEQ
jgi:hypothetical protein